MKYSLSLRVTAAGLALLFASLLPADPAVTAETGRISGTAVRAADGSPIASGTVYFTDPERLPRGSATVVGGSFSSPELAPGLYRAYMPNTATEAGQVYGGPACFSNPTLNRCDLRTGTLIEVVAGQDTRISFSLAGAFIGGEVLDREGNPAAAAEVEVWLQAPPASYRIWSQPFPLGGPFRAGPFPPGAYAVVAKAGGLARQIYPDQVCLALCSPPHVGEAIQLAAGEERQGIDFRLRRLATLTGRVEERASGAGLAGAELRFYEAASRRQMSFAYSGADGRFSVQLPPGTILVAAGGAGREWRAHPDVPFLEPDEEQALVLASPLTLPEGGQVELEPLRLRKLGSVRGKVLDAASGLPIGEAAVWAFRDDGGPSQLFAETDPAGGAFEISGLEPGETYYLAVEGPGDRDLLVGGGQACIVTYTLLDYGNYRLTTCDPAEGQAFGPGFDQTIDAGEVLLPAAGRIRGSVRLAGARQTQPTLQIFTPGGRHPLYLGLTEEAGVWTYDVSVPGGGSFYLFATAAEYLTQVYDHQNCPGDPPACLELPQSAAVTVAPGAVRDGIDFDLALDQLPCTPSPTTLCLGDGRFTVRNRHQGNLPSAAGRITDDAGYFTFFDPANVELVVKVLDACRDFDSFWVSSAGLTDVSTNLEVRDNWTARTQRYYSIGPYRSRIDYTSFRGCGIAPPEGWPAAAPQVAAPRPALVPNGCGSDPATSLCLGDRFKVEARWETALGEEGIGQPHALTADTGFFHFFSPGNIEVVVKVLNACRSDLNNHYWIFAAGLTDVAVTLTVTDTVTGEPQVYLSPLGRLFQPIFDFEAFAGCS